MSDAATVTAPGPGHNREALDLSLALDPDQLLADLKADTAPLLRRTDDLVAAFGRFAAVTKDGIADDEAVAKAGDFARQLGAHVTAVDARRTVVKAPVLAAQRTIDGYFKGHLSDPVEQAKTAVVRRIEDYQRRQREAAALRAREEADRQRAEAARLAAEAERQRSTALMDAAVEAEARAEQAAIAPVVREPVRSDFGTTVGTRVGPWKVRVTDISKVPPAFLLINEQVLVATAKTDPRVAAGEQPVPGVEFYRETRAAIR